MLQQHEIKPIEALLVEFYDIFARHRFDIGVNEELTVKLTPKNESPAYSQSLPTPINLKEDILVELALLHKYGIITTLPFSKYASPFFAQKKPNGKLRLLNDLRKINNLISDDYINKNLPVSTLTDAAQHMAGKNSSANLTVRKPITVSLWHTSGPSKCWPLTSLAGPLPIEDWHKDSVESIRPSPASCEKIWTESLKLINALNM